MPYSLARADSGSPAKVSSPEAVRARFSQISSFVLFVIIKVKAPYSAREFLFLHYDRLWETELFCGLNVKISLQKAEFYQSVKN